MHDADPISAVPVVAGTVEAVGALLLAVTFGVLSRTSVRPYPRRWAWAWFCQAMAAAAMRCYVATGGTSQAGGGNAGRGWWIVYLVAGWYFAVGLWIGCREMARGAAPDGAPGSDPRLPRLLWTGLPAAIILAGALIPFFLDLGALLCIQAAVLTIGYAAAFAALGPLPPPRRKGGFQLMRLALGWLAVQFALYVALYLSAGPRGTTTGAAAAWLARAPLAELAAQLLLGAGMALAAAGLGDLAGAGARDRRGSGNSPTGETFRS